VTLAPARISLAALVVLSVAFGGCTIEAVTPPDVLIRSDASIPNDTGDAGASVACAMGSTLGDTCTAAAECDDGCFCNGLEVCSEGSCAAGSVRCLDAVDCTDDACDEETDTCANVPNHELCADGMACNGAEQCDLRAGCLGAAPLYCNDESACTVDSCDDAIGCVYTIRDLDGDGFTASSCGGQDCDDDPRYGPAIFPGAAEDCTNRRDDNCDGRRDYDDDTCLPTNDSCLTATALTLGPTGGLFSASTEGLRDDHAVSCATSVSSGDAVFSFTLAETMDVTLTVSGTARSAVALRPMAQCAAGPDLRCGSGSSTSLLTRSLPAGEYAVLVRTSVGESFDLRVVLEPPTTIPPVDRCDGATLDVTAGGTFRGRFDEVTDLNALRCHAGTGYRDAAYRIVIPNDGVLRDVTLRASTSGASFSSSAYLQLTTDCADPSDTLRCTVGSTAAMTQRSLGAGTYYVLLESSSTDATAWTLDVTVGPAGHVEEADVCLTALDVTPTLDGGGRGSATRTATLSTLSDDGGVSCGTTSSLARDAYFVIDLPIVADVTFTTTVGTAFIYTALQEVCGITGSERRCRSGSSPTTQFFRSLAAGPHYFAVQVTTSVGEVSVTADVAPGTPIPAADTCPGALVDLGVPVTRTETLLGYEDDLVGGSCAGGGRPDAFFTFTLPAARRVLMSADPVGTTTVYLSLRDGCAGAVRTCTSASGGTAASINEMLPAGTYTLMVEMPEASVGPYELSFVGL
jgi:hypothetical protein